MKKSSNSTHKKYYMAGISVAVIAFISSVILLLCTVSGFSTTGPQETGSYLTDPGSGAHTAATDRFPAPVTHSKEDPLPISPSSKDSPAGLEEKDFAFAVKQHAEAFCDPLALEQGYAGASSLMERGNCLFFVDPSSRSIVKYDSAFQTSEVLVSSREGTWIGNLQEQYGSLFFEDVAPHSPRCLCMLPCDSGTPVTLYADTAFEDYLVYGAGLFVKTSDALVYLDLNAPDETRCLWKNTDEITLEEFCVHDTGVILELRSLFDRTRCLYHISPDGTSTLLFQGTGDLEMLQATENGVYFVSCDGRSEYQLVSIDCTQNSFSVSSQPLASFGLPADSTFSSFRMFRDQLFFLFTDDDSFYMYVANLHSEAPIEHYVYENPHGERVLDTASACSFLLGEQYLYLQGKKNRDGLEVLVRIPRTESMTDCSNEEIYDGQARKPAGASF